MVEGGQAALLHGATPQLDVGPLGIEDVETNVGAPLEEGAQVVAVGLEGPTAVTGQERSRRHLCLGETRRRERSPLSLNWDSGWA